MGSIRPRQSLVGVGVGLMVDTSAPEAVVDAYGDSSILAVIETVGSLAWLVAAIAAGIAMFNRAHTRTSIAVVLLFVISAPGVFLHVSPVGPIALVLLAIALCLVIREPAPVAKEQPLVTA